MKETKIEWAKNPDGTQGYTWNPITGCLNHTNGMCKGGNFPCYAYRLAHGRLKQRYLANGNVVSPAEKERTKLETLETIGKVVYDPFYPRFWSDKCNRVDLGPRGKPKGVFVCDMSDLFGIGIPEDWTHRVLDRCKDMTQHRFYLLTKQPQNLAKFSPFPENCYVGVSVTRNNQLAKALKYLRQIRAAVKFISFEPLLERIELGIKPSIGYNTEYESEIQRSHSLQDGRGGGIGDRRSRESLACESTEVGQMERRQQNSTMRETQGRKRHRQISPSEDNDKRETLSRIGSQASMVSLQRDDTTRINHQPQRRECKGQSSREYGTNDLQPKHPAFYKNVGQDIQERQVRSISWVIIGAMTCSGGDIAKMTSLHPALTPTPYGKRYTLQPKIEWVEEIVKVADKAGVPVFLKDNLWDLLYTEAFDNDIFWANERATLRQEMPDG